MQRLAMLGVLCALGAAPSLAHARPKRAARCPSGWTRVKLADASASHAYFDLGAADGLEVGAEVRRARRRRKKPGPLLCRIERTTRHHARCATSDGHRGDLVCFAKARPAESSASSAGGARLSVAEPSPEGRRALKAELTSPSSVPHVVDEGVAATGALALRADARLRHDAFLRSGGGGVQRSTVRVWVKDAPLGFLDTTASVDLSVLFYSARPGQARFRAESRAHLYVHETAVARRARDGALTLGLGRIRPWHAPGIAYLDGAQVGWRISEAVEVGVLGGGLPDLVRLEPTTRRWMAGLYGGGRWASEDLRLDLSGRAGVLRAPETGTAAEVEASARVGVQRWLSVWGAARLRAGDGGVRLPSLRGRIDLRPGGGWHLALDGRLRDDTPDPYAASLPVVAADHARATLRWQALEQLSVGVTAGVGRQPADDLLRAMVGPQLGAPTLFGALGGLWVGYQEAFGDLPGRTGWVQARLRPTSTLEVWARASYRGDRLEAGPLHELGGFVQVDWRALSWLRLRGSGFGRLGLLDRGAANSGRGLVVRGSLVVTY